jgi:putative transposase
MGIPELGVQYVIDVANSPPARKVGRRRRRNLVLDVPMTKLGVALQGESLSGEFLFLVELDRRNDLRAVYDQPLSVPLVIVDSSGRRTRIPHTADYLVVEAESVLVYEIKADDELDDLCRRRPSDWRKDESGYHYLPAVAYFLQLGIKHITIPNSSLSSIRADNLRLLASSRQGADTKHLRKMRHTVLQAVLHEGAVRVGAILDRLEEVDATAILQLIDGEQVFAALDKVSLSDIRNVWIAATQESANLLQQSDHHLADLLRSRSSLEPHELVDPRYHAEIATRLAMVDGILEGTEKAAARSARSIRRYREKLSCSGGDPASLAPRWAKCGNRDLRIGETHRNFIVQSVHAGRSDGNCRTPHRCYKDYVAAFDDFRSETGLSAEVPVARSTYYLMWDRIPHASNDAHLKGGRRLQNALSDVYDPTNKTVIATRPFAVAHIDHWKADLFVVVGHIDGKKISARPWLTAMVDAYSGEVLAIWLSFAAPSKKACSMVIRDCVRRHGRLPEMLIVDGGSEFKSVHFSVMLATFGVIRCERPPEDPRFGQEVERLFGHFKERFAKGLPGYGLSIEQSRSVSGALKAHKRALLSLLDAYVAIDSYAFIGYNRSLKPGSLSTRLDIRTQAMAQFPRCGRLIKCDLKFMVATSIEAPASRYTLWNGRGVHINDRWYSSPGLLAYRGFKKDFSVRIEPFDSAIIYVCIEGKWLVCHSSRTSLHAALVDQRLMVDASEFHDLSAARRELTNDMDSTAAEIVTAKLQEIASKEATSKSARSKESLDRVSTEGDGRMANPGVSFDDIEPLAESDDI